MVAVAKQAIASADFMTLRHEVTSRFSPHAPRRAISSWPPPPPPPWSGRLAGVCCPGFALGRDGYVSDDGASISGPATWQSFLTPMRLRADEKWGILCPVPFSRREPQSRSRNCNALADCLQLYSSSSSESSTSASSSASASASSSSASSPVDFSSVASCSAVALPSAVSASIARGATCCDS